MKIKNLITSFVLTLFAVAVHAAANSENNRANNQNNDASYVNRAALEDSVRNEMGAQEKELFDFIECGNPAKALKIIDAGNFDVNAVNTQGNTALMEAIFMKSIVDSSNKAIQDKYDEIAYKLINMKGINLNKQNDDKRTAFMLAIMTENEKIAQRLLDTKKIDFTLVDRTGHTALMRAVVRAPEIASKILDANLFDGKDIAINQQDNEDRDTALILAIDFGKIDLALKILGVKGLNLNLQSNYEICDICATGNTALMRALERGYKTISKKIIENSNNNYVNFNAQNSEGDTALMIALRHYYKEIVDLLLSSDRLPYGNLDLKNKNGETALDIARAKGKKATADKIIEIKNNSAYAPSTFPPYW